MEKHVSVLGVLYIAFSALGILAAVAVMIGFGAIIGKGLIPEEVAATVTHVGSAIALFLVLVSAPGIVGGIGLLKRQPWARILVLVLGFISLIGFPFGTVLGIYTIWVLMKDETVRLFASASDLPTVAGDVIREAGSPTKPKDYRLSGMIWISAAVGYMICVALSVGMIKGMERAVTWGIWGVLPLAVGVAMYIYGSMVRKEQEYQAGSHESGGGLGRLSVLWAVAAATVPFISSSASAYTHEEVFQKTVPASGIARLSVRNLNGEIRVEPWERPEIQIEAKKRVSHSRQEGAESYARKIGIAVETKGDMVEVRTIMPGRSEDWDWVEGFFSLDWLFEGFAKGVSVSYAISAPRRMNADLKSTNGAVRVGAMEGHAELKTTNGALSADGFKGELTGRSTNGAITLSRIEGGCDAATTNGAIKAEVLALGGQGCKLRSTNGAIRVALPESARADLVASTTNGRITCDLPLSLMGEQSKRRTEGKVNGGGPPIELRTTNGSITIVKGEGKELAAVGLSGAGISPFPGRPGQPSAPEVRANFLRIQVWEGGEQKVKITVPLSLARETLRSLPEEARDEMNEKGIDIDRLLSDIVTNPKPGKLVEIQDDDKRVEIELVVE